MTALTTWASVSPQDRGDFLEKMAGSLDSRPANEFVREWSFEELAGFQSQAFSALRLKDEARLISTIKDFGGVPDGVEGNQDLLFLAARDPAAWGFGAIYEAVSSLDPVLREERRAGVGAFLRSGICLAAGGLSGTSGVQRARQGVADSRRFFRPVGACLAQDNPRALAWLLGDPDRFAALAKSEPAGRYVGERFELVDKVHHALRKYHGSAWAVAQSQDARLESCLIFQAVAAKAPRCAALLAAIPEFAMAALDPERLLGGANVSNSTFVSEQRWVAERGQEGSVPACRDQVSLLEEAIFPFGGSLFPSGENGAPDPNAWERALKNLVQACPESAKKWRQRNGMGFPEVYLAVEVSASAKSDAQERDQRAMRMLSVFADSGFEIQWENMAQKLPCRATLAEWLRIQGAAPLARDDGAAPTLKRRPQVL